MFSGVLVGFLAQFCTILHKNTRKILANISSMTTKLYLDDRHLLRDGTATLKLAITKKSKTAYLSLDIRIAPEHWDKAACKVIVRPDKHVMNANIVRIKSNIDTIIYRCDFDGEFCGMSATAIKNKVSQMLDPDSNGSSFLDFYRSIISSKRESTKIIYATTLRRLERLPRAEHLTFDDITPSWLQKWQMSMEQEGLSTNYISIQLRNIRNVFNLALDAGVTRAYPFRKFKMPKNEPCTRSLDVETLREIFNADVEPFMQSYLDIFKLHFLLIGINIADLCALREIKNGRIEYRRAKTKRWYSVKVEPEALEIIERHRGKKFLLDIKDRYKDYRQYRSRLNRALKKIGKVEIGKHGKKTYTPIIPELTTYYARHSWATIAVNDLNIPVDTVSVALGHTMGNPTTAIYVNHDLRKVDEANRRVIDWVLYGKR